MRHDPARQQEVVRRLQAHTALFPPDLGGVVLEALDASRARLRWQRAGQLYTHVISDVVVAIDEEGVPHAVPLDDPDPDFFEVLPAGVVVETEAVLGFVEVPLP